MLFGGILLLGALAILKGLVSIGRSMVESQKQASEALKVMQQTALREQKVQAAQQDSARKRSSSFRNTEAEESFQWTPEAEQARLHLWKLSEEKPVILSECLNEIARDEDAGDAVISVLQFGGDTLSRALQPYFGHATQVALVRASTSLSASLRTGLQTAHHLAAACAARSTVFSAQAWDPELHHLLLKADDDLVLRCFNNTKPEFKGVLMLHMSPSISDRVVSTLTPEEGPILASSWSYARQMTPEKLKECTSLLAEELQSDDQAQATNETIRASEQKAFLLSWAQRTERTFAAEQAVLCQLAAVGLTPADCMQLASSRVFIEMLLHFDPAFLTAVTAELPTSERAALIMWLPDALIRKMLGEYPEQSPVRLGLEAALIQLAPQADDRRARGLDLKELAEMATLCEQGGPGFYAERWHEVASTSLRMVLESVQPPLQAERESA